MRIFKGFREKIKIMKIGKRINLIYRQRKQEIFQEMAGPGGQFNYYPNNVAKRALLNQSLASPPLNNEGMRAPHPYDNTVRFQHRDFSNPKIQNEK